MQKNLILCIALLLGGCASAGAVVDHAGKYDRQTVSYGGSEPSGSIVINTKQRFLYHIHKDGTATRYGVGVGRSGFDWKGVAKVRRKQKWPSWRPPQEMRERELAKYNRTLPVVMAGGINNPLGARALYLFQGTRDTLYRIHGTNDPSTIGKAVSSGCIRLKNDDVTHLYSQVALGTKIYVR